MKRDLGPLEMRVLGLLEPEQALAVAEVQQRMLRAGHEYAYTTLMTVLNRLCEKGFARRKKDGPRYVYRPAKRSAELKRGVLEKVQHALFGDRVKPIAALLDQDLSRAELEEIRALVDKRLSDK